MEAKGGMSAGLRAFTLISGVRVPDLSGCLPYPKVLVPLFRVYCWLTDAVVLTQFVSFTVVAFLGEPSITERCFRLFVAVFSLNGPLVFLCLQHKRADIEAVSASLAAADPEPRFRSAAAVLKFIVFTEVIATVVWFLLMFVAVSNNVRDDRLLAHMGHYTYNLSPTNLKLVLFSQSLGAVYTSTKVTTFDVMVLNLCSRLVVRYTSLRESLSLAVDSRDPEKALRVWINEHQETIKLADSLQNIFSLALLIHFSIQLFIICTIVFFIVKGEIDNMQATTAATFILVHLSKLFLICRIGDHISSESDRISEEFGDWYNCSKKVKNMLIVILTRTKVNMKLSAIGVFPLSSETFRSVIATAYSYYTFLDELK